MGHPSLTHFSEKVPIGRGTICLQPQEPGAPDGAVGGCEEASDLCEFHRTLSPISPTEAVVERAFSVEVLVHSSTQSRLSDGRGGGYGDSETRPWVVEEGAQALVNRRCDAG